MSHIYDEWKELRHCDTLYYTSKIQSEIIDSVINVISLKTAYPLSDIYMGANKTPLTLTKVEKTYLKSELKKLKSFEWPAKMFPNSKVVPLNGTKAVYLVTHKLSKTKSDDCSIIYTFSKPIYIRDSTIALYLNQEQYSNTSTQLTYNFYHKEDGEWLEYANCYINMGEEDTDNN